MNFKKYCDRLVDIQRGNFYIWGTGNTSELYYEGLKREKDISVKAYIDSDSSKWGANFHGFKIISPAEYRNDISVPVLISSAQKHIVNEIENLVARWGGRAYTADLAVFSLHYDEVNRVIENLYDERSREVYASVLCSRLGWDEIDENVIDSSQYFPFREFQKRDRNDIFIDCGAFVGDSIEEYIWKMDGVFDRIYAFEPDICNFAALNRRIERISAEWNITKGRINTLNLAVGANDATKAVERAFGSNGLGSRVICEEDMPVNGESIGVVSLDSFFEKRSDKVSFIKADIESYEYNMLLGAKKIIRRYTPRLAICIYHNPTDFYSIPILIKSINPKYNIAVRHHSYTQDETVLYAWMSA